MIKIYEKETDLYGNRKHEMPELLSQDEGAFTAGVQEAGEQTQQDRRADKRHAYCTDILIQVAAVNAALNSFNKELLASHIKTCVAEDIRNGKDETIDELVSTLQKLMR